MMPFSARLLSCLLTITIGLSACAQMETRSATADNDAAADAPTDKKEPVSNSPLDARLMYEILVGEISFQLGDAGDGTGYLLEAARHSGDETLYERAVDMAIQAQSADLALQVTRAWHDAMPDSLVAVRYELQVLLATGQVAATEAPLRQLMQTLPEDEKIALITAMPAFFEHAPNQEEAAEIIEHILADVTDPPELAAAAWTSIGRVRLQAGNATGALSAARLGQSADGKSQWPAILALQLLADGPADIAEPAELMVTSYLEQRDAAPVVRLSYAQLLIENRRYEAASAQLEKITDSDPDHAQAWLLKGMLDENRRHDEAAQEALEHYLKLAADDDASAGPDRARLALARIATRRGEFAHAERWLDAIDADDDLLQVQLQRAEVLAQQGKLPEARAVIQSIPEAEPADARTKILAEAHLLREHGQPAAALQLLNQALQEAPDDEDLLYDTAMTAVQLDDIATMERLLRHLIALNPEAAHAYNALGYSLAERGMRLPEAQSLIETAVQLAPDDGYIQDSLGWVQYKQGNLEEARQILTEAYDKQPDAEIAAHLGEVLWQLGEHDAARAAWKKGLRLAPDNEALQETMQRLDSAP